MSEVYTTAEFARLLGVSRSTVARLVDAGRIPARRVGTHRRIFREDLVAAGVSVPSGTAAPPRRSEMERLAPQIHAIVARHRGRNPRLFGSVARGDADEVSDVDLLVELDSPSSLIDLAAMELELQDLLGRRVDVGTPASLKPGVRDTVLADAVPI